jgi:hypothetical protein
METKKLENALRYVQKFSAFHEKINKFIKESDAEENIIKDTIFSLLMHEFAKEIAEKLTNKNEQRLSDLDLEVRRVLENVRDCLLDVVPEYMKTVKDNK